MRIGYGHAERPLSTEEVRAIVEQAAAALDRRWRRILVLVPDGTRTMPLALLVDLLEETLGPCTDALDYLVALGTHRPMNDEQLTRLLGRPREERPGRPEPGLQPRLQPRIPDARRDDLRRRGGGDHRGAPDRGGPRPREPARLRLRRRPRLRAGLSARGRRLLGGKQVLLPRHRGPGGHQPDALARGAPLELRGHRLGLHAGARPHRPRGGPHRPAEGLLLGRRHARGARRPLLRRPARGVARGVRALGARPHHVGRRAVPEGRLGDASDVRGPLDGGEGDVQGRAGRGRRGRGRPLRAAPLRGELHARSRDRGGRLPLPRLLPRAVGAVPARTRGASSRTRRTSRGSDATTRRRASRRRGSR